jgi:hypothetical protein
VQIDAQKFAPAKTREHNLRHYLRMRQRETRERFTQLFGRPDVRVRAFACEPTHIIGILRERRPQKRTPRRERKRIGQQPLVAREFLRHARMLRREPFIKRTRLIRVRQVAHERLDLFVKLQHSETIVTRSGARCRALA